MRLWVLRILLMLPVLATAAPGDSVRVDDVLLIGHKKTRPRVVYREMTFGRGDTLAVDDFVMEVGRSYNNLMNTGLFVGIDMVYDSTQLETGHVTLLVKMRETWYIYPVPVFELADRNFNVWWNEQERSLERVNVGGKLAYYNFTGRRDRLRLGYTTGYTRSLETGYRLPYINRAGSLGINVGYNYDRRREQNFITRDNRQEFFSDPDNDFVYRSSRAKLDVSYRRRIYVQHTLSLGWQQEAISDTIARFLNPDFFGGGRNRQRFFRIAYQFSDDRRDVRNYPWKGHYLGGGIAKDGLGIYGERDGLYVHGDIRRFIPFGKHYSLSMGVAAKYSLIRTRQPFLDNRAIGFGDNGLVGYQFYVVDGLDMLIWRAGLRRELFRRKFDFGPKIPLKAFRYLPVRVLASIQFNQGVANAPFRHETNRLNNNLLTGFGAGIDFVFYYDMVGGVQYNRNHLGEDGIYLNVNMSF